MTESASKILSNYIEKVSRFTVYSIEMEQGENPEDLYYLCNVDGSWYVVYETDYFAPLSHIVGEASQLFGTDVRPRFWLTKRDTSDPDTLPLEVIDNKLTKSQIALSIEDTYLRYAVLAVDIVSQKVK